MNYEHQRATPQQHNEFLRLHPDHVQYFDVQINASKAGRNQPQTVNQSSNYSNKGGETLAQSNPYSISMNYFSKRKEKQNNGSNGSRMGRPDKFINIKSTNNILKYQQSNKSAGVEGGRIAHRNAMDRNSHLQLKSLGSQKSSEVSNKLAIAHKVAMYGGKPQMGSKIGSGLGGLKNQENNGHGSIITSGQQIHGKYQPNQLKLMSQMYGSAEAILSGNQMEILSNENYNSAIAMRSIDGEQREGKSGEARNGNPSSISQRNDYQNLKAGAYQFLQNPNQQFLKKNSKAPANNMKLNDLQVFGSKKSSQSVQKSPLSHISLEPNINDALISQNLSKMMKRDSSYPDAKLQLQHQARDKSLYLDSNIDPQQQLTILSQQSVNQQIQHQPSLNNKRSPNKQSNPHKIQNNFSGGAHSRNVKMNVNSTTSTNPSTSQLQLRNQKMLNSQQKVNQILIHPSSLTKMQQIKNIYSMQNINNKYVVDQAHRDANSSGFEKDHNHQSQLDVSQQSSSMHFNPGASGTPKLNESQTSYYQNMQNTSMSLVSKTISIQGQNIGKQNNDNRKNSRGQRLPIGNEYGGNSPNEADLFTNQRRSQQSQKTVGGKVSADKDSLSGIVAQRNAPGANTSSNTIVANSKPGIAGTQNGGALHKGSSHHQLGSQGAQHILSQKTAKLQKVGINRQLQKAGSKNFPKDQSLRQTQNSQWNMGSQNSKLNSYYNTKSSFGIRNSSKNNAKQSIDYSKMEVRGKGGQVTHTSIKQSKHGQDRSNILPKPTKLSSQLSREVHLSGQQATTVLDMNLIQNSNRKQSRNVGLHRVGQKTETAAQNTRTNKENQNIVAAYNDGPTSRSLEPVDVINMDGANASKITSLHQYFRNQNLKNQMIKNGLKQGNFMQDQDHQIQNGNNHIPIIRGQNSTNPLRKNTQLANIQSQLPKPLEQTPLSNAHRSQKNGAHGGASQMLSAPDLIDRQKAISKTEAQNTMSKKQIHNLVDAQLESASNRKDGPESNRQMHDSKSLEAVDYFQQQGRAFKQHMKSQQLKSRLKNLQYSQVATESQHSMMDAEIIKSRGPKPNLDVMTKKESALSNNLPGNIKSSALSVKQQQLPQIGAKNQSKSETKVASKFDTQIKQPKPVKQDMSSLSLQKNRNHQQMTEERANNKLTSNNDSPDQLSDQQTALKTPQNHKMFKKNFQYSQNVQKNLVNIEKGNKQTPQGEERESKLLAPDSDIDAQNLSQNNTKLDIQSHDPSRAHLNDSYENLNLNQITDLFSKRKMSKNNMFNVDAEIKYSPQLEDNASYSSLEKLAGKSNNQPQTVNKGQSEKYKIQRKNQELDVFNNQSDGSSFPHVNNDQLTDELRFAPMNGVRDGFGVGPGTANTHGGYTRQKYKRNQDIQSNMNYKLPSQQCYSEIVNFDNQQNVGRQYPAGYSGPKHFGENNNQNFNIMSNFEQSFEYAFDPTNFQHLDALDPFGEIAYQFNQNSKEEVDLHHGKNFEVDVKNPNFHDRGPMLDGQSSIPSIHSVPIVRNQKSQATYRHNHQKISVSNKYHYYNNQNAMQAPSIADSNQLGQQSITQQQLDNMTNLNISQLSGQQDMMGPNIGFQLHHPQSIKDGNRLNKNDNQEVLSSFINNENRINASQISQLSNDSDIGGLTTDMIIHNGGTRTTQNQHQLYLSKRDGSLQNKGDKLGLGPNETGTALSTGDDGNPFNGPKIHMYRKGQSKSSQSKQRKVKTTGYHQRLHELNSNYSNMQHYNNSIIQNYGQGGNMGGATSAPSAQSVVGPANGAHVAFSASQSQHAGGSHLNRQLSEGGTVNSLKKKSHSNTRKPKEGHINISEILNGNFKLQPANSKFMQQDQLYTDTRSQNSQGLISQNSNEFCNGPPKGINFGENGKNMIDLEFQSQTHQKNTDVTKKERDNSNENISSAMIENQFDSRIQNTPSQFSTIQQNVSANMFDDGESQEEGRPSRDAQDQSDKDARQNNGTNNSNFHFPKLAGVDSQHTNAESLAHFNTKSPYLGGGSNINSSQRLSMVRKIPQTDQLQIPSAGNQSAGHPITQNEAYLQRLYEQQKQGMRPNTTNPTEMILSKSDLHQASPDGILQKPKIPIQKLLKPIKSTSSQSNQNFKHPKVGNNSKHPPVFKNLQSLQGKMKSQSQTRGIVQKGNNQSEKNVNQLGLFQSHSQETLSAPNQHPTAPRDRASSNPPQPQPYTDQKKSERTDPLNDTQLTEQMAAKSKNPSQHSGSKAQDSPVYAAADKLELQNRNQHFETTFEGFNQSADRTGKSDDPNQTVSESQIEPELRLEQSKQQHPTLLDNSLKTQEPQSHRNQGAKEADFSDQATGLPKADGGEKALQSRTTNGAKPNTYSIPAQQSLRGKIHQDKLAPQLNQAKFNELNQLMEQEIDQKELSNSANKTKGGNANMLKNSVDAKNIQHLREKNYENQRKQFESENKQNVQGTETAENSHSIRAALDKHGLSPDGRRNVMVEVTNTPESQVNLDDQQSKELARGQQDGITKQINGLNSIHSAVPHSVTQIEAVPGSVTDLAKNEVPASVDSPGAKDGREDAKKISGLQPIKQNLSVTPQIIKKSGGDDERVHSSIEVDDAAPIGRNHLTSSPGNRNSSEQQEDKLAASANTGGINMNQTQTSHSIAQTPCFAETPNTTDQFKGYQIDPNDRINMSGMILNTQQLNIPHNIMASSSGMAGVSISGSTRGIDQLKEGGGGQNTPQLNGQMTLQNNTASGSRGMSAKIINKNAGVLADQPYRAEILESESLLESEQRDGSPKKAGEEATKDSIE